MWATFRIYAQADLQIQLAEAQEKIMTLQQALDDPEASCRHIDVSDELAGAQDARSERSGSC